ncbi:hypothetical protein Tco_0925269 [Tanacetum coccineum]|uniref:Reverse transcriptase domain-containing protein n=1 Tax=Tanacetum coccineum TaxID=301880 RepID=A0ABQ5D6D1_9ASTR
MMIMERYMRLRIEQLLQDHNGLDIEKRKKERILMEEKSLAISRRIQSICDDDEDDSIPLRDIIARYSTSKNIIPDLPSEEPEDSLIMGDKHLSTISEKESDELIKSSVENLVPIPVIRGFPDNEKLSDVLNENFKIYSNPLFDEEIISSKIEPCHFNAESDLIESLLNRDILTVSYPKIDSLLKEFSGELAHIDLIPPGIVDTDFDPKEEILLIEELLYDNSSPRPPEESNSEISNAIIKSLSPSPIPVEDSDPFIEEIDIFFALDDSTPPYNHFTFDVEPDTAVKNDFDELNEDECFDPGGGEIDVFENIKDDDYFA